MKKILDIYPGNRFNAQDEKNSGTEGVIIKVAQGEYSQYLRFGCRYIDDCERVGLPWGTYWLVDSRISPEKHRLAMMHYYPYFNGWGKLGLWLDVEKPNLFMKDKDYRKTPYKGYKLVMDVFSFAHSLTERYPGIYTGPGAWMLIMGGAPKAIQDFLAQNSLLWDAHYGVLQPSLFGSWTRYTLWQYRGEPDYSWAMDEWYNNCLSGVPTMPPFVDTIPVLEIKQSPVYQKLSMHRKKDKE